MNNIVTVTVHPQGSAAPCVKRIRAFYPDLPMGDLEYYDVVEGLNGIDRRKIFRELLEDLEAQGVKLDMTLTQVLSSSTTVEPFTLRDFDTYMDFSEEIRQQVELDCDREAEE